MTDQWALVRPSAFGSGSECSVPYIDTGQAWFRKGIDGGRMRFRIQGSHCWNTLFLLGTQIASSYAAAALKHEI